VGRQYPSLLEDAGAYASPLMNLLTTGEVPKAGSAASTPSTAAASSSSSSSAAASAAAAAAANAGRSGAAGLNPSLRGVFNFASDAAAMSAYALTSPYLFRSLFVTNGGNLSTIKTGVATTARRLADQDRIDSNPLSPSSSAASIEKKEPRQLADDAAVLLPVVKELRKSPSEAALSVFSTVSYSLSSMIFGHGTIPLTYASASSTSGSGSVSTPGGLASSSSGGATTGSDNASGSGTLTPEANLALLEEAMGPLPLLPLELLRAQARSSSSAEELIPALAARLSELMDPEGPMVAISTSGGAGGSGVTLPNPLLSKNRYAFASLVALLRHAGHSLLHPLLNPWQDEERQAVLGLLLSWLTERATKAGGTVPTASSGEEGATSSKKSRKAKKKTSSSSSSAAAAAPAPAPAPSAASATSLVSVPASLTQALQQGDITVSGASNGPASSGAPSSSSLESLGMSIANAIFGSLGMAGAVSASASSSAASGAAKRRKNKRFFGVSNAAALSSVGASSSAVNSRTGIDADEPSIPTLAACVGLSANALALTTAPPAARTTTAAASSGVESPSSSESEEESEASSQSSADRRRRRGSAKRKGLKRRAKEEEEKLPESESDEEEEEKEKVKAGADEDSTDEGESEDIGETEGEEEEDEDEENGGHHHNDDAPPAAGGNYLHFDDDSDDEEDNGEDDDGIPLARGGEEEGDYYEEEEDEEEGQEDDEDETVDAYNAHPSVADSEADDDDESEEGDDEVEDDDEEESLVDSDIDEEKREKIKELKKRLKEETKRVKELQQQLGQAKEKAASLATAIAPSVVSDPFVRGLSPFAYEPLVHHPLRALLASLLVQGSVPLFPLPESVFDDARAGQQASERAPLLASSSSSSSSAAPASDASGVNTSPAASVALLAARNPGMSATVRGSAVTCCSDELASFLLSGTGWADAAPVFPALTGPLVQAIRERVAQRKQKRDEEHRQKASSDGSMAEEEDEDEIIARAFARAQEDHKDDELERNVLLALGVSAGQKQSGNEDGNFFLAPSLFSIDASTAYGDPGASLRLVRRMKAMTAGWAASALTSTAAGGADKGPSMSILLVNPIHAFLLGGIATAPTADHWLALASYGYLLAVVQGSLAASVNGAVTPAVSASVVSAHISPYLRFARALCRLMDPSSSTSHALEAAFLSFVNKTAPALFEEAALRMRPADGGESRMALDGEDNGDDNNDDNDLLSDAALFLRVLVRKASTYTVDAAPWLLAATAGNEAVAQGCVDLLSAAPSFVEPANVVVVRTRGLHAAMAIASVVKEVLYPAAGGVLPAVADSPMETNEGAKPVLALATSQSSAPALSLLPSSFSRVPRLISLPRSYDRLLANLTRAKCGACGANKMEDPALCLLCGELLCAGSACCKTSQHLYSSIHPFTSTSSAADPFDGTNTKSNSAGEVTRHARECNGGVIAALLLNTSQVLLVRQEYAAYFASPYLDAHGEPDHNLSRGKPLFLDPRRYALLSALVFGGTPVVASGAGSGAGGAAAAGGTANAALSGFVAVAGGLGKEVTRLRGSSDRVIRYGFY
jgi:Proteolysis_6 C-terminal